MKEENATLITKEKIVITKQNGVGIIKLNNPKSMNSLDDVLAAELLEAALDLGSDESIGAVVLTGSEKAFCAGGDLKKLSEGFTTHEGYRYMKSFHQFVKVFSEMEKPTIAAVNGYAVGAGFCIALLADIIIASDKAVFGMAFKNVGLIPDLAGLYTLPRLVGLQRAKELVLTAKNITAQEAHSMGIANLVVSADELSSEAVKMAKKFASGPRIALKLAKCVMNQSVNMTIDQLLELESQAQAQCFQSEDHKIALDAFFKKEKPVFTGK